MPTLQLSLLTILHHVLLISQSFNSTFRKYGRHNYFRKVSHFYSSLWEARIRKGIFLRSSRPAICLFVTSGFVMWMSLVIIMQYNSCFNITVKCNVIVIVKLLFFLDEIRHMLHQRDYKVTTENLLTSCTIIRMCRTTMLPRFSSERRVCCWASR